MISNTKIPKRLSLNNKSQVTSESPTALNTSNVNHIVSTHNNNRDRPRVVSQIITPTSWKKQRSSVDHNNELATCNNNIGINTEFLSPDVSFKHSRSTTPKSSRSTTPINTRKNWNISCRIEYPPPKLLITPLEPCDLTPNVVKRYINEQSIDSSNSKRNRFSPIKYNHMKNLPNSIQAAKDIDNNLHYNNNSNKRSIRRRSYSPINLQSHDAPVQQRSRSLSSSHLNDKHQSLEFKLTMLSSITHSPATTAADISSLDITTNTPTTGYNVADNSRILHDFYNRHQNKHHNILGPYNFMVENESKTNSSQLNYEDMSIKDLQTVSLQLHLLQTMLNQKNNIDSKIAEDDVLYAWSLTHNAEVELAKMLSVQESQQQPLQCEDESISEVMKLQKYILDTESAINKVNNHIAPVFEKLSLYLKSKDALNNIKSSENALETNNIIQQEEISMKIHQLNNTIDSIHKTCDEIRQSNGRNTSNSSAVSNTSNAANNTTSNNTNTTTSNSSNAANKTASKFKSQVQEDKKSTPRLVATITTANTLTSSKQSSVVSTTKTNIFPMKSPVTKINSSKTKNVSIVNSNIAIKKHHKHLDNAEIIMNTTANTNTFTSSDIIEPLEKNKLLKETNVIDNNSVVIPIVKQYKEVFLSTEVNDVYDVSSCSSYVPIINDEIVTTSKVNMFNDYIDIDNSGLSTKIEMIDNLDCNSSTLLSSGSPISSNILDTTTDYIDPILALDSQVVESISYNEIELLPKDEYDSYELIANTTPTPVVICTDNMHNNITNSSSTTCNISSSDNNINDNNVNSNNMNNITNKATISTEIMNNNNLMDKNNDNLTTATTITVLSPFKALVKKREEEKLAKRNSFNTLTTIMLENDCNIDNYNISDNDNNISHIPDNINQIRTTETISLSPLESPFQYLQTNNFNNINEIEDKIELYTEINKDLCILNEVNNSNNIINSNNEVRIENPVVMFSAKEEILSDINDGTDVLLSYIDKSDQKKPIVNISSTLVESYYNNNNYNNDDNNNNSNSIIISNDINEKESIILYNDNDHNISTDLTNNSINKDKKHYRATFKGFMKIIRKATSATNTTNTSNVTTSSINTTTTTISDNIGNKEDSEIQSQSDDMYNDNNLYIDDIYQENDTNNKKKKKRSLIKRLIKSFRR